MNCVLDVLIKCVKVLNSHNCKVRCVYIVASVECVALQFLDGCSSSVNSPYGLFSLVVTITRAEQRIGTTLSSQAPKPGDVSMDIESALLFFHLLDAFITNHQNIIVIDSVCVSD